MAALPSIRSRTVRAVTSVRQAVTRRFARWILGSIFRLTGTRVYMANIHRIGDSLIDVGFYVKARQLGWRGHERSIIVPAPRTRHPANVCALAYLARHVSITTNQWLYPFLFECLSLEGVGGQLFGLQPLVDGRRLPQYEFAMAVEKTWEDQGRPPLFRLTDPLRSHGTAVLTQMGVGDGEWFVCVHVREAGFLREPPTSPHRHLNADVMTYLPAIDSIVAGGGWVVRMGDSSMRPLPSRDRVIDYAHSRFKSAEMDVFLAATCRYWLGTNSGLFTLAFNFGVPVALTNVAPATFRPWSYRDLFIPKLYRSRDGQIMTFRESLASELYASPDIDIQGVTPIDNDPDDIGALTAEMHQRLEGTLNYDGNDQNLQARFNALRANENPLGVTSRVGQAFLRKHAALLEDSNVPERRQLQKGF